ncbi:MAG: hypothetical protein [Circular genetic element sp.]|nr:MAG: hypothetical protein [Circular genetic element sp.]
MNRLLNSFDRRTLNNSTRTESSLNNPDRKKKTGAKRMTCSGLGFASAKSGPFFIFESRSPSGWLNPFLFYYKMERSKGSISLKVDIG